METNEYKELQRKPGVYCTTDEDGGRQCVPFRHMVLTNVPWLYSLTMGSPKADQVPTLSWD